jgi:N-acetyl-alpha-D-muramate 1-phosphate uridylyltransferase
MQVVILAGGLGTRMLPHTKQMPKFLLPVCGKPFAWWLLHRLKDNGFQNVILCIGHLGERIQTFVGSGSDWGMKVTYVEDGPTLLGTGGALLQCANQGALEPTFLVTYGDSYLPEDYQQPLLQLEQTPHAEGVMSVFENQGQWGASNTSLNPDKMWVQDYQKSNLSSDLHYIDYGALALRRTVFTDRNWTIPFGLDQVQTQLANQKRLAACLVHQRFYEVGSPQGLTDLEEFLRLL